MEPWLDTEMCHGCGMPIVGMVEGGGYHCLGSCGPRHLTEAQRLRVNKADQAWDDEVIRQEMVKKDRAEYERRKRLLDEAVERRRRGDP